RAIHAFASAGPVSLRTIAHLALVLFDITADNGGRPGRSAMNMSPNRMWPSTVRWSIPRAVVGLLIPMVFFNSAPQPGRGEAHEPPVQTKDPVTRPEKPVQPLAGFQDALKAVIDGKAPRRDLRISLAYDGKQVTKDGRHSVILHASGPGQIGGKAVALTKAQQDELLSTLRQFPWQEIPRTGVGDVTRIESATAGIIIRVGEWSKSYTVWVAEAQPSVFDAKGKPDVERVAGLAKKIKVLLEAAPKSKIAIKNLDQALAEVASGKLADELMHVGFRYDRKINVPKKDPPKKNPAAKDEAKIGVPAAEGWSVWCDGPVAWTSPPQTPSVLVLPAKDMRELARFLKDIKAADLHKGREKLPHEFPRYRRPGRDAAHPWKTRLDFSVRILDFMIGVEIQDPDELPAERRRPYEQMLERFEKLHRRLQQDGKPMINT